MTSIEEQDIARAAGYPLRWEKLYGKTVLITGATGFIGSFIIRTLSEHMKAKREKIRILAVVRDIKRAKELFGSNEFIAYIAGDVVLPFAYEGDVDFVIHCASNAAPDQYMNDPVGTMKTNFYGTLNSLDCAKKCGAQKYLYVSTIEVYGNVEKSSVITEDDFGFISSTNIRSCYPESKKCCENLTMCYGKQNGLDVTIGRLSYIYGAGMRTTDSKVCALFAREVAENRDPVLKSSGQQRRSYTYVSDAVTGLLTLLLEGEEGQAYNVASSDSTISIVGMADMYCALFPEKNVKVRYEIPAGNEKVAFSFIADAVMDTCKITKLGWKAAVPLEEGLTYAVRHHMELLEKS